MSLGPVEDFLLAIADAGEVVIEQGNMGVGGNKQHLPCTITPADLHKAFMLHHSKQGHGINQTKLSEIVSLKLGIKLVRPHNSCGVRERVFCLPVSQTIRAAIPA